MLRCKYAFSLFIEPNAKKPWIFFEAFTSCKCRKSSSSYSIVFETLWLLLTWSYLQYCFALQVSRMENCFLSIAFLTAPSAHTQLYKILTFCFLINSVIVALKNQFSKKNINKNGYVNMVFQNFALNSLCIFSTSIIIDVITKI